MSMTMAFWHKKTDVSNAAGTVHKDDVPSFLSMHGEAIRALPWGTIKEAAVPLYTLNEKNLTTEAQRELARDLMARNCLVSRAERGVGYYSVPRLSNEGRSLRAFLSEAKSLDSPSIG